MTYSRVVSARGSALAWQGNTQHAAVHQLTERYDRASSSVLVRCVDNPTRASLDFAAWDGNGMRDATLGVPAPRGARTSLRDVTFGGALVPGSAGDSIGDTPMRAAESSRPMSWRPAVNYLGTPTSPVSGSLAAAGWLVEGETWGEGQSVTPYQEISRLFLRRGRAGVEAWVEIEFKAGVEVVAGVTDDDGDGFTEIYGRLEPRFLRADAADRLARDYAGRALGPHDTPYGPYYASSLAASDRDVIPNVASDPALRAALGGVTLSNPAVAIRAEPRGTPMHTFIVVGCARP